MSPDIRGAGGKSGGGGGISEAQNNLVSKAYARVLDLVSEGEIEGLVNGLQSVYFNETPLQNPDESYNFDDALIEWRYGTQGQDFIPGFDAVENEIAVAVDVVADTPVVRSVTNSDVDAVRVRISLSSLQDATSGSEIKGSSVEYAIDLQSGGGGYVTQVTQRIQGKTNAKYERAHRIELTGEGPWDVRVRRITPDSESATLVNGTRWETYTEIIDAKLRYPNSAIFGFSIDSTQFASIPRRAYHLRGRRIKVPTNHDPATRTYTGVWDGTFKIAYSNNPAWVYYDLLTNRRYGLGKRIPPEHIDKWSLYQIGRYCDELVPDGFGGEEPRMVCNLYLQTRQDAWRVLDQLASVFRGIVFWSAGQVTAVQDRPSDPVLLYTNANVIDGLFTYSGASRRVRHTVALVTWNDPADFSRQKVLYVADEEGIRKYGVIPTEVVAVGATTQGQARRFGRAILISEQTQTDVVSFVVGLEGALARPGQVVKIADSQRAGVRLAGRLMDASIDSITLDAPVTLVAGQSYTLTLLGESGAVIERPVTTGAGSTQTITVSPEFDAVPAVATVWALGSDAVEPALYRVISVSEPEPWKFQITALRHAPDKYAAIDADEPLEAPRGSSLYERPATPTGLVGSERRYVNGTSQLLQLLFAWQPSAGAVRYELELRAGDSNPVTATVAAPAFELMDASVGAYVLSVWAISLAGKRSAVATASFDFDGIADPPAALTGVALADNEDGTATLSWMPVTDPAVISGGRVEVRFREAAVPEVWDSFQLLATVAGDLSKARVPLLVGTYLLKPINSSNVPAAAAASLYWTGGSYVPKAAAAATLEAVPVGTPVPWPFPTSPGAKFLAMDGSTHSVDDYPELGALYGGSPGGDFTIKDWSELPVWGAGVGTVGDVVGENTIDLSHTHGAGTLETEAHDHGLDATDTPALAPAVVGGTVVHNPTGVAEHSGLAVTGETDAAVWSDLPTPAAVDKRPRRALVHWYQRALK